MGAPARVLGVDPGSRVTGWGVVERTAGGGLALVAWGALRPAADAAWPERLRTIHQGVLAALDAHAPEAVAVEEAFAGLNVKSAIRLGEARAVCILGAALRERPVHELPPALVKKVVAGHGQAGKDAVRDGVLRLLGRAALVDGGDAPYDATDALALAVTALVRLEVPPELAPASVGRRPRRRGWTAADLERLGADIGDHDPPARGGAACPPRT